MPEKTQRKIANSGYFETAPRIRLQSNLGLLCLQRLKGIGLQRLSLNSEERGCRD